MNSPKAEHSALSLVAPLPLVKHMGEAASRTCSNQTGNDADTAAAIDAMGAKHVICPVNEIHIDEGNNVLSTPAYMLAKNIAEAAEGIDRLVSKLLERCPASLTPAG